MSNLKSPPVYEQERRAVLAAVARDAERAWRCSNEHGDWWRRDLDVVVHALRHSPTAPPESALQNLGRHRSVVLAKAQREDFLANYRSKPSWSGPPPEEFRGDKQIMLAYVSKVPRLLQDCSESLTQDFDVVAAAVSGNGMALQYASRELQQHPELLRMACRQDGRALSVAPLLPRSKLAPELPHEELWFDRLFFSSEVIANGGGSLLKDAPLSLQRDPDLVVAALGQGLRLRYVDDRVLAEHPEIVAMGIRRKAALYSELPVELLKEESAALAACVAPDTTPEIQQSALDRCPQLHVNRDAVLAVCERGSMELIRKVMVGGSAVGEQRYRFSDDKPVILAAVKRDPMLVSVASPRLRLDADVILASIHDHTALTTLAGTPWAVQHDHPEITIKCITVCKAANLRLLPLHLPQEAWQNRDVVESWIKRGGRVLESFEGIILQEAELALTLIEYNVSEAALRLSGSPWWHDRDFLLQGVSRNGILLGYLPAEFHRDLRMVATAVAQTPRAIVRVGLEANNDDDDLLARVFPRGGARLRRAAAAVANDDDAQLPNPNQNAGNESSSLWNTTTLTARIDEQLNLHDMFQRDVLRGVHQPTPLALLNCGMETSQAILRHIAEYLGVPLGPYLATLRRARHHVDLAEEQQQQANSNLRRAAMTRNRGALFGLGRNANNNNRANAAGPMARIRVGRGGGGGLLRTLVRERERRRQVMNDDADMARAALQVLRDDMNANNANNANVAAAVIQNNDNDDEDDDDDIVGLIRNARDFDDDDDEDDDDDMELMDLIAVVEEEAFEARQNVNGSRVPAPAVVVNVANNNNNNNNQNNNPPPPQHNNNNNSNNNNNIREEDQSWLGRPPLLPMQPPPPQPPLRRILPPLVPVPLAIIDDPEHEHRRFLEYFANRDEH